MSHDPSLGHKGLNRGFNHWPNQTFLTVVTMVGSRTRARSSLPLLKLTMFTYCWVLRTFYIFWIQVLSQVWWFANIFSQEKVSCPPWAYNLIGGDRNATLTPALFLALGLGTLTWPTWGYHSYFYFIEPLWSLCLRRYNDKNSQEITTVYWERSPNRHFIYLFITQNRKPK